MGGAHPSSTRGDRHFGFGGWGGGSQEPQGKQKQLEKLQFDARNTAWKDDIRRFLWVLGRVFPPPLSKTVFRSAMHNQIEVNEAVLKMLLTFRDFDVLEFTNRGAVGAALPINMHLRLAGGGASSPSWSDGPVAAAAARATVGDIGSAFGKAASALDAHPRDNYAAIQVPRNRRILAKFINQDMDLWLQAVGRHADDLGRESFLAPDGATPAPPALCFRHLNSYLATGGLINTTVSSDKDGGQGAAAKSTAAGAGSAARSPAKKGACREWGS